MMAGSVSLEEPFDYLHASHKIMSCSLKIYNKIYSKTKLLTTTLSLPPFWQCAHTQFNPVTSHATNDSHRLSRLTQSLAWHGLSQRVLRYHLPCIVCHCPPSAHSVHLGQLHHSLRTGLSAFTGYSSATMATTPPCSATRKPDHQDPLVRLSLQLLSQARVNPFSPFSIRAPVIARLSNHGL